MLIWEKVLSHLGSLISCKMVSRSECVITGNCHSLCKNATPWNAVLSQEALEGLSVLLPTVLPALSPAPVTQ